MNALRTWIQHQLDMVAAWMDKKPCEEDLCGIHIRETWQALRTIKRTIKKCR